MAITDILKKPVFKIDGLTMTVGLILVALLLVYFFYWRKKM